MTPPTVRTSETISQLAYPPAETSALAVDLLQAIREDKTAGVRFGVARFDEVMNPARGGELISVYGLPGHHKSGIMNHLSKRALAALQPEADEIVVRATWEQSVEEDTLSWMAMDSGLSVTRMIRGALDEPEWKIILESSIRRAISPMWIVGHSQLQAAERRRARSRMTMTDIALALEYISEDATDRKLKVKMVVLDYLQRVRPDPQEGQSRREQIMEAVNRAKDCAISFGCPVVMGVQARREVAERDNKMPRQDDAQESSNVEQTSDKIISLWYPWKTEKPGSIVKTTRAIRGLDPTGREDRLITENWQVTPNLLLVGMPKQKMGPTIDAVPVFVDPSRQIFTNIQED